MEFSELRAISSILYKETIFRSVSETAVRRDPERILKSVDSQMWVSKALITLFTSAIPVFTALNPNPLGCSVFLLYVLFMFVFFFLQVVTAFVSQSFDLLHTLPLSDEEVSRIKVLTFLRIFDLPLAAIPVTTLIAFGVFSSPRLAFWMFLGVLTSELLAISSVFRLARFFYSKIAFSTGGWRALLRIVYLLAWSVSVFGVYLAMGYLPELLKLHADTSAWKFLYPFCFEYAARDSIAIAFSLLYLALSVTLLKKILPELNERVAVTAAETKSISVKTTHPVLSFLKKDLKIVSRSPAYVVLVILPVAEGMLFMKPAVISVSIVLLAIIIVAFTAYSIESGYTKTLPVDFWTITAGKTLFILTIYILAVLLLSAVRVLRGMGFSPVGLAQIPSVLTMGVFVSIVQEKVGLKKDLYTGLGSLLLLVIPCSIIAYTPIVAGVILRLMGFSFLLVSFAFGMLEFAVVAGAKVVADRLK